MTAPRLGPLAPAVVGALGGRGGVVDVPRTVGDALEVARLLFGVAAVVLVSRDADGVERVVGSSGAESTAPRAVLSSPVAVGGSGWGHLDLFAREHHQWSVAERRRADAFSAVMGTAIELAALVSRAVLAGSDDPRPMKGG